MQRIFLFALFLCLHWVAWGQENYEYRYWFDKDEANMQTGTFTPGSLHLDVDLSTLDASLHTIHIQVKDSEGEWSSPVSRYFVRKATALTPLVYWLDNQVQPSEMSAQSGHFDLDVSALDDGIHLLRLQLSQLTEGSSSPVSKFFFKMPLSNQTTLLSWFDSDHENVKKLEYNGGKPFLLDVSEIADGFHVLYLQAMGKGGLSMPTTKMFIKIPQTEGVSYLTCACSVDGKLFKTEQVSSEGGVVNWNLDVASLSQGIHNLQVQVLTPTGVATNVSNHFFFRAVTQKELSNMKLVYSLDGNEFHSATGDAANGVFHFDVDVASLEDGLHTISYMLSSNTGVSTVINNAFFWKIPVGGYGIKSYSYWLNDNEANAKVKVLDKRESSFSLVSLLPVDSEPIRSSCFQFEVKDGKPMMYAKNDFHIAFYDASNRRVDETKQYVDYNVSQAVEDISDLLPTQTFARPEENSVKWFMFEANYGDSIALKSSQATSIQIFDTSGKELYGVSGSSSIEYGGCHLFEDGIFYVAVHDVTGSKNNITLDIKHIDKYAVFEFTPNRMSGVGRTIMYFKGNGLDQVKSIKLKNDEICLTPDTIVATSSDMLARFTSIEQLSSDKKVSLEVFFNNVEKGDSRTITFDNAITLEPVNEGQITVDIVTENRVGDPYPIKVTLKNSGNLGCYGIPLNIAYDNVEAIDELDFLNFDLLLSARAYESREFFAYTDDLIGMGKKGFFMPLLIPYLGPYDELTIVFGVKTKIAHALFDFYAWAGDPWYEPSSVYQEAYVAQAKVRRKAQSEPCDESELNIPRPQTNPDNYNDPADRPNQPYDPDLLYGPTELGDELANLPIGPGQTLRPWLGAAEAISGIIQGSTRARDDAVLRSAGMDPNDPDNDQFRFHYRTPVRSPLDIWEDANPFQVRRRNAKAKAPASGGQSADGYASNPCPGSEGHHTNVWIPGDPNEMHGYVSESGSKYVTSDVKDVYYSIEFENNPEIANASAHRIVVSDTLDAQIFDLSSFKPTRVQIGDRIMNLDGEQNFTKTMDMRPEIDAIAQVDLSYDEGTGIAQWTISSLDPMTMEETYDIMQGVLPINSGGNGLGFLNFDISLKNRMADGATFTNKAGIVFDYEETIMTPLWVNTIDAVSPTSQVTGLEQQNDSILTVRMEGSDDRSGVWKYEVYAQYGKEAPWWKVGECTADSAQVDFHYYNGIDYGFCVLATDSAGNVETKELAREASIQTFKMGDVNDDDEVNAFDVMLVQSMYLGEDVTLNADAADVNGDGEINVFDAILIQDIYLSTIKRKARQIVERKRKQQVE